MTIPNRIRHSADTVLDQIETRGRIWNTETLAWEPVTEDELKTLRTELREHRRILEEILIVLKGG